MKRIFSGLLPLLALGLAGCSATRLQTSPAQMAKISEALQARDYTIEVFRADPMGGRTVDLSAGYGITVRGDSIFSRLPFFGRAYSVPYGGSDQGGFFFDAKILNYQSVPARKGSTVITIETRTNEDSYTYHLTVWDDGNAMIDVDSFNRQGIDYDGTVVVD